MSEIRGQTEGAVWASWVGKRVVTRGRPGQRRHRRQRTAPGLTASVDHPSAPIQARRLII